MNIESKYMQYPVGYHVHKKYGFIGATPDGIVHKEGCIKITCHIAAGENVALRDLGKFLKLAEEEESYTLIVEYPPLTEN